MTTKTNPMMLPYVVALVATAIAIAIRSAFDPWLGEGLPLVTLFGAVAVAVWFGGFGPALASALSGWLACTYLFVEPRYHFYSTSPWVLGSVAFALSSGVIIAFGDALYRGRRRARAGVEFLRTTLSSIGDGVITTDADTKVTFMNPVAEDLTGWTRADAAERPLADVFRIINEVTREPEEAPASEVLRTGKTVGLANHTVLIDRQGGERIIDDSAAPIRSADGGAQGVVLVFRDNSARRLAEKRLSQSEKELNDFFDNASVGMHWVGRTGTILRANRAELEMLGYPSEEYVGRNIAEFHVDADLIRTILSRLSAGETMADQEAQMRCKDGSVRDVLINSSALLNERGEFVHSRCFTTDVTEQRRDELASQRLAAIVESSEDAIVAKDLSSIVTSWNKAAERMFGYSADEMIGQSIRILIPAEHADEESDILDQIKRGIRVEHFESIRLRKDGSTFPVSLTISPIRDRQGNVVGASKIARDITALKAAERALIEADRRKDNFLATLAHELRNPLAPIRNAVYQLKLDTELESRSASSRDVIDRQSRMMTRLIDDLLDVSRITRNRLELKKQRTTLAEVIEAAAETSRPLIERGKHALSIALPTEPIYLTADPTRLAQVFSNLLNNAAKFMKEGGSIRVTATRHPNEVMVSVKDTGMGISAASLPHIFDLFAQSPAVGGVSTGLGIGLALARGVVDLHNGSIEARSEGEGAGAELIVTLPISEQSIAPARSPGYPLAAPVSRRVLIVDDNHDSAETMAVLLRMSGHEAEVAHDGEAALSVAERFRPEMVLLDLGMPTMDGLETCRRMRASSWGKNILIVALTGLGQREDRRRTKEAGFDDHLLKPLGYGALQNLLHGLCPVNAEGRS
jgi:PAS domain S-box-containing protein